MLRQEMLELGVRRNARLSAESRAGKRTGRIRHAECIRQAGATIERSDQHAAECIACCRCIYRHDGEGILRDQLTVDTSTAAPIPMRYDHARQIDPLHTWFDAAFVR